MRREGHNIGTLAEKGAQGASVTDVTDLLENREPTALPPREQPKLFEARDFTPYVGAKWVFWDKMGNVRPSFKADCYAMLHITYHIGLWGGAPALLIAKYLTGN